jgi:hypothetical protein
MQYAKKKTAANNVTRRGFGTASAFLLVFLFVSVVCQAQLRDSVVSKKRLRTFTLVSASAYGVTLAGLNHLWYQHAPRQSFHFFNDDAEWKQVDKLGHLYSSFYLSYATSRGLQWSHVPVRKSDLIGAMAGFLVLVPVEVFDGFSAAYGASAGDLVADAAGASLFLGQKLLWNEVRLIPKFSYHPTGYAANRPDLLGDSPTSRLIKDYNGQTYWLAADMDKFIRFPKWLNLAAGYGAQGMVYARDAQNTNAGYSPYRQYYLAIDLDLSAIKTRSKFVKSLIFVASMIRLPAPALEFNRNKVVFHPLYF